MPLCEKCSKLDFSGYRVRKRPQDIDFSPEAPFEYAVEDVPREYDIGDYSEPDREDATLDEDGLQSDSTPEYEYTNSAMIRVLE